MANPTERRPGEALFEVILLVFAATAFWQSYGISGFTGKTTAGVFPMLASATMIVSALAVLVGTLRKAASDPPVAARFLAEILPLRHALVIALVAAYLVAMPYIGFVASSGLFLFAAFQYLWRRNVLVTLLLTAGTLAAVYFVFREVFQVVLPQGIWLRGVF